jgi:hypothetical protein
MYGGYNNRGRGRGRGGSNFSQWSQQPAHRQPPREGDEKIPPGQWPGKRVIIALMEKPAANLYINRAQPVYECNEPDEAPNTADYVHVRDDNEVAVYGRDLTEHGLRGQLLRLYDALCYGVLRAYKRDCVFRLVDKWELLNFNPESQWFGDQAENRWC